jgi:excisionase family DNA binding protein
MDTTKATIEKLAETMRDAKATQAQLEAVGGSFDQFEDAFPQQDVETVVARLVGQLKRRAYEEDERHWSRREAALDALPGLVEEVRALASLRPVLEQLTVAPAPPSARPPRKAVDPSKVLLRLTEAARLLGVDPKTTLARLVASGGIRTVKAPRGRRIPRSEVERLLEVGIPAPGERQRTARRPRTQAPGPDVAARIRALPVE